MIERIRAPDGAKLGNLSDASVSWYWGIHAANTSAGSGKNFYGELYNTHTDTFNAAGTAFTAYGNFFERKTGNATESAVYRAYGARNITLNGSVAGGVSGVGSISDGSYLQINGGTFTTVNGKGIYAAGYNGTVNNHINLTIAGGSFDNNYIISAGSYDGHVTYGSGLTSCVTLKDIDGASDLAKSGKGIALKGGEQTSDLVLSHVTAQVQASLS